jgi:hypothetical protein
MLTTGVINRHGYSYNNRRSGYLYCKIPSYTLPFCKKGAGQARQLNVCVVFGIQVTLVPKR